VFGGFDLLAELVIQAFDDGVIIEFGTKSLSEGELYLFEFA
jgi:hypothetical protein